jgi:hypothetical protein
VNGVVRQNFTTDRIPTVKAACGPHVRIEFRPGWLDPMLYRLAEGREGMVSRVVESGESRLIQLSRNDRVAQFAEFLGPRRYFRRIHEKRTLYTDSTV